MKRILFCVLAMILVLFCFQITSFAQDVPEDVKQYANSEGFERFLYYAPKLNLPESVQISDLQVGDGYNLFYLDVSNHPKKLSDAIRSGPDWLFPICSPEGEGVSIMRVHTDGGLSSGGGGDSANLIKSIMKMKELIRLYGEEDSLKIIDFGEEYLLYYSFGEDERIMEISPWRFNEAYLSVNHYTQLPTGTETLQKIIETEETIRNTIEQNPNYVFASGGILDLNIKDPSITNSSADPESKQFAKLSPFWIFLILILLPSVILIIIIRKKQNDPKKE